MTDKGITVTIDDIARKKLLEEGFDSKMGARPLQRVINTRIKLPLSKKILFDEIKDQKLNVTYDSDNDEYTIGE
jgi:ATP-dependent Clp protease ATP-binding subunit ClpA